MRRICVLIAVMVFGGTSAMLGMATSAGAATAAPAQSSPPAAPSNVENQPFGSLDFYISWQINSANQTGFQIYNGVTTETVGPSTDYYEWATQPGQYMCIAVRAYNSSGYSAWAGMWTCATTPGVQSPPAGVFSLDNYHPGQCLDIYDGQADEWAVQWDCNDTADQAWHVGAEDGTSGYYQLVNGDGECLGVYGGSTASGADVVGWQCLGTGHRDQYWAWIKAGVDGSYDYLLNYNSGQVLAVYDNLTTEGVQIVQSASQASLNSQLWQPDTPTGVTLTAITDQSSWTGYSAEVSPGADIYDEEATWTVPAISCPGYPQTPRVDVWVGMWGTMASLSSAQEAGWLPQIGTDSSCDNGALSDSAQYRLTWEMETEVGGQGSGQQQYGLDCPGSSLYSLCGSLTSISAGDQVQAAVAFLGPYTTGAAVREFEIRLTDLTSGEYAQGYIYTSEPVTIPDIAAQGGAIVEDSPACTLLNLLSLCGVPIVNPGGLAKFSPSISLSDVFTEASSGPLVYNEWVMENSDGNILAYNSPLAIVNDGMAYTVTWNTQS
jgi:hypothetical protein